MVTTATDTPRLQFSAPDHRYFLDGEPVPSVTQILREAQFIDFHSVPLDVLAAAQERGTLVHQALHYLNEGDLNPDSVPEHIRGYLEAGIAFRRTSGMTVYACEWRVYSQLYRVAGTVDLFGLWEGQTPCLADYKTGDPDDVAADLQLAAYAELARETAPEIGDLMRVSVRLSKDGRFDVEVYDNPMDFSVFLAALTVANERRRRAKKGW